MLYYAAHLVPRIEWVSLGFFALLLGFGSLLNTSFPNSEARFVGCLTSLALMVAITSAVNGLGRFRPEQEAYLEQISSLPTPLRVYVAAHTLVFLACSLLPIIVAMSPLLVLNGTTTVQYWLFSALVLFSTYIFFGSVGAVGTVVGHDSRVGILTSLTAILISLTSPSHFNPFFLPAPIDLERASLVHLLYLLIGSSLYSLALEPVMHYTA